MLGFLPIRVFVKGVLSGLVELLLRRFYSGVLQSLLFSFPLGHFGVSFPILGCPQSFVCLDHFFFQHCRLCLVAALQSVDVLLGNIFRARGRLGDGETIEYLANVQS